VKGNAPPVSADEGVLPADWSIVSRESGTQDCVQRGARFDSRRPKKDAQC